MTHKNVGNTHRFPSTIPMPEAPPSQISRRQLFQCPRSPHQVRLYDHRGIYPVLMKGTLTPCARLPPNTIIVPSSMVKVHGGA